MSETTSGPGATPSAQLAELVTTANRFLGTLSAHPLLMEIGLSEWRVLHALGEGGSSNGCLARAMGVTKQRMNQIVAALVADGYVALKKSSEDSRRSEIAITQAGVIRLAEIDARLAPILVTGLQGRKRAMQGANAYMKAVTLGLAPAA